PGVLDDVFGFGEAAEHPVGDPGQLRAKRLEFGGDVVALGIGVGSLTHGGAIPRSPLPGSPRRDRRVPPPPAPCPSSPRRGCGGGGGGCRARWPRRGRARRGSGPWDRRCRGGGRGGGG